MLGIIKRWASTKANFVRIIMATLGIFVVVYNYLVFTGDISSIRHTSLPVFVLLELGWTVITLFGVLYPKNTKSARFIRIAGHQALIALNFVFLTGPLSPLMLAYIQVTSRAYVYFDKKGLYWSLSALPLTFLLDLAVWRQDAAIFMHESLSLILLMGVIFSVIRSLREKDLPEMRVRSAEKARLLESNRIFAIMNNINQAIIVTNASGIVNLYNAAALNLLDTNVDIKGHAIDSIFPVTDLSKQVTSIRSILRSLKTTQIRDDLFINYTKDDKARLEITFTPIKEQYTISSSSANVIDGYILIIRDVTRAKSLEEEKDEFISVISHELRTPLAIAEGTISNATELLKHTDATKTMLEDAFTSAHNEVVFLSDLVNDLSTLSRAERNLSSEKEFIDVKEFMYEMHRNYQKSAKNKKLALDIDLSHKLDGVVASRLYLQEIIQNFITNAIKYTQKGHITMSAKQKDGYIIFAVSDTGIGMSRSDLDKIFTKFYRVEDYRTRETSGTGLGLYIAAKLASRLGTKINVVSRLNHGSEFSVILPVASRDEHLDQ